MENKVTVVIPTYNGAHRLGGILKALEEQTVKDFEVIIAIDGSKDHTQNFLQKWQSINYTLRYFYQHNRGRAAIRNFGAKQVEGGLIIFFDDDMRPIPDCLEQHIEHHRVHPGSFAVGKPIEDEKLMKTDVQKYKRHLSLKWYHPLEGSFQQIKNSLFFTAANCSFLVKDFWEMGGFDNSLKDWEDYDFGMRLLSSGKEVYFLNSAIAYHDDFITAKGYLIRLRQYQKAKEKLPKLNTQSSLNVGFVKMLVYRLFGYSFWIDLIEKEFFRWLPSRIRYKMYDIIFTSLSQYFYKVRV